MAKISGGLRNAQASLGTRAQSAGKPTKAFLSGIYIQPHDKRIPLRPTGKIRFVEGNSFSDDEWQVQVQQVVTERNKNFTKPTIRWVGASDLNKYTGDDGISRGGLLRGFGRR